MKISELIEALEKFKTEHGDCYVGTYYPDMEIEEVVKIEFYVDKYYYDYETKSTITRNWVKLKT